MPTIETATNAEGNPIVTLEVAQSLEVRWAGRSVTLWAGPGILFVITEDNEDRVRFERVSSEVYNGE